MSIQTEREEAAPVHPLASIVGVDVGIARFATHLRWHGLRADQQFQKAASAAGPLSTGDESQNQVQQQLEDRGWFEFRRQLEYKQVWRGGQVVVVNPRNTSRTCPCCGHVSAENRQTQARFACVECGCEHNADLAACGWLISF